MDRVLCTLFGAKAVELITEGRFGRMVAHNGNLSKACPLPKPPDGCGRCRWTRVSSTPPARSASASATKSGLLQSQRRDAQPDMLEPQAGHERHLGLREVAAEMFGGFMAGKAEPAADIGSGSQTLQAASGHSGRRGGGGQRNGGQAASGQRRQSQKVAAVDGRQIHHTPSMPQLRPMRAPFLRQHPGTVRVFKSSLFAVYAGVKPGIRNYIHARSKSAFPAPANMLGQFCAAPSVTDRRARNFRMRLIIPESMPIIMPSNKAPCDHPQQRRRSARFGIESTRPQPAAEGAKTATIPLAHGEPPGATRCNQG